MRRRLMMLGLISLMLVLTLGAACGSDGGNGDDPDPTATTDSSNNGGAGGAGGSISIVTTELAFDSTTLSVSAGEVTVNVTNDGALPHDFTIDSPAIKVAVNAGASESGTVDLSAGTYTYYCSIPGHRDAGMQGTLTVT